MNSNIGHFDYSGPGNRVAPDGFLSKIPSFWKRQGVPDRPTDSEEKLHLARLFEESKRGWFWSTDEDGCLAYVSEPASDILNTEHETLLGADLSSLFVREHENRSVGKSLPFLLLRRTPFENLELRSVHRLHERWWSLTGVPQFNEKGFFTGFRGSALDITDQRNASLSASRLAKYDSLTGLSNRLHIAETLESVLGKSGQGGSVSAIMMIDLDRFKQINDTLGHPAGDAMLKQVAGRLLQIVGSKERVSRLGGDEFKIVFPDCGDSAALGEIAAEIISSLSEPYIVDGSRCTIGASIGIALAPDDGRTREELVRNADLALYASKAAGRGRFQFFSCDLLKEAEETRALEEDLRDALSKGELALEYQPVVDAATNRVTGVEALIRWNHARHGPISPAKFIPLAEETNLIVRIGEWVIRKACEDASKWPGRIRVAVNVSPIQFSDKALPSVLLSAIEDSGISPDQLELEVTEGVLIGESAHTHTMFATLREIGVRLSLDDFGTGYSSLGYLRSFRFDKIKIDQSFIKAANDVHSHNRAIIAAIITLADAMGMETTAEGIESLDQLALVRSLGATHVQGFVYSKAVTHEELNGRLENGEWVLAASGVKSQRSERRSVYRSAGAIYRTQYQQILIRNLSETGALVEGLVNIPVGEMIAINFGDGELVFAKVRRANGRYAGVQFHEPLVRNGSDGFQVRTRFSDHQLAQAGIELPHGEDVGGVEVNLTPEQLASRLGCSRDFKSWIDCLEEVDDSFDGECGPATVREAAQTYLESLGDDVAKREADDAALRRHILPRFGHLRRKNIDPNQVREWLTETAHGGGVPEPTVDRLGRLLQQLKLIDDGEKDSRSKSTEPGVTSNDRTATFATLSEVETAALSSSIRMSSGRVTALLSAMIALTGAKSRDLLNLDWRSLDSEARTLRVGDANGRAIRSLPVNDVLLELFDIIQSVDRSGFVFINPSTKRPYRSVSKSWETITGRADLAGLELDDLRFCLRNPEQFVQAIFEAS